MRDEIEEKLIDGMFNYSFTFSVFEVQDSNGFVSMKHQGEQNEFPKVNECCSFPTKYKATKHKLGPVDGMHRCFALIQNRAASLNTSWMDKLEMSVQYKLPMIDTYQL